MPICEICEKRTRQAYICKDCYADPKNRLRVRPSYGGA